MVEGDAKIDVRFDPIGREQQNLTVTINRLRQHTGALFAVERGFEDLFGSAPGQLMRLGGGIGNAEWEGPLAADGIEGTRGAGRNDEDFAAMIENAEFLKRKRGNGRLSGGCGSFGEFQLDESDGAANAAGRNSIFGEALDGAESDEVAEGIEMLAPARAGRHQTQAFPVSQAARIHPNDAAGFFPRKALRQASGPRVKKILRTIMHLMSMGARGMFVWNGRRSDWWGAV